MLPSTSCGFCLNRVEKHCNLFIVQVFLVYAQARRESITTPRGRMLAPLLHEVALGHAFLLDIFYNISKQLKLYFLFFRLRAYRGFHGGHVGGLKQ